MHVFFTAASKPTDLVLEQVGETTISVSWKAPGNALSYRLYWVKCNETQGNRTFLNPSTTTAILTDLDSKQCYNVCVVGISEHLPSEPISSTIFLG